MIKTLRITSIIAVVLAVVFFVLPAVFGVRSNKPTEQFLNSASVMEKFNKAKGKKSTKSESQVSPLVKQAEAFALYLNPPEPKKAPATSTREMAMSRIPPRPTGPVSPKFKLIGTSYYALHPELSLALIDEVGKGLRWVKQSGKVGHLIIEQVKDGLVVVRDSKRTFELVAERPEKRSLLKKSVSSGARITGSSSPRVSAEKITASALNKAAARITSSRPPQASTKKDAVSALGRAGTRITSRKPTQASIEKDAESALSKAGTDITNSKPPQMSEEELAAYQKEHMELAEKIFAELEAIQADIESNKTDSEHSVEEDTAKIKKNISDIESSRISAEEAERLDHLGKELENVQQDPNQAKDDRTESDANSSEANSPAEE
jgi:hypothetical protein